MNKVAEVLEGLREEESRLSIELSGVRRAITALEQVMGIATVQESQAAPPQSGPYAESRFYDAAAAYLEEAGEPRSAREIAEALRAGGYRTRAKDFNATVRTMLQRHLSSKTYGVYATENGDRWFFRR